MPVLSGMACRDGGFMDDKAHWLQCLLVFKSIARWRWELFGLQRLMDKCNVCSNRKTCLRQKTNKERTVASTAGLQAEMCFNAYRELWSSSRSVMKLQSSNLLFTSKLKHYYMYICAGSDHSIRGAVVCFSGWHNVELYCDFSHVPGAASCLTASVGGGKA